MSQPRHIRDVMLDMPELTAFVRAVTADGFALSDQERADTLHFLQQPRIERQPQIQFTGLSGETE